MVNDTDVRLAVYEHFVQTGRAPTVAEVAEGARTDEDFVRACYLILADQRVLVLGDDGESIVMAPPFSGVETPHVVTCMGVDYFANCAWDALGILAAMQQEGVVRSVCPQSGERLELAVDWDRPAPCDWVFHCLVPASHWWDDIGFT